MILFGLTLAACGEGLIHVDSLIPVIPVPPPNPPPEVPVTNEDVGVVQAYFIRSYEVDTSQELCSDGTDCMLEPFTPHFARVTIVNDYPADPQNPLFGRERITSYTLTLDVQEADAPATLTMPTNGGPLLEVLQAGDTTVFEVVLADAAARQKFAASGVNRQVAYVAQYEFAGTGGILLTGAARVLIGPTNRCPEDMLPVLVCP